MIPFAVALARLIPPKSVRLRRDFGQILLAIKAHALIHRAHRQIDDRDQIVADFADYVAVATLMGAIVSEASGTKISKAVQDTVDAVKQATKDMFEDQGPRPSRSEGAQGRHVDRLAPPRCGDEKGIRAQHRDAEISGRALSRDRA